MLKIAYLLPGTSISGGSKVVFEHASFLRKLGIRATVIAQGSRPTWCELDVPFLKEDPLRADLSAYNIIVTTFYNQIGPIVDTWNSKRVIHFCQGYEADYAEYVTGGGKLKKDIERAYQKAPFFMTVNNHTARKLKQYDKRISIIGQGINFKVFHPPEAKNCSEPNVLVLGQFEWPFKGVETALKLAQTLKEKNKQVKIIRINQTPRYEEEQKIADIDEYHVAISPSQVADVMRRSCLGIFVPEKEGFGLPLVEAMACGLPVLASDIAPFREIGPPFPLFNIGKQEEEALKWAEQILSESRYRSSLHDRMLKRARSFSYRKVIFKVLAAFVMCLAGVPKS